MRSVQVSKPEGPLEIVEREIPEPEGQGTVGREPDDSWLLVPSVTELECGDAL